MPRNRTAKLAVLRSAEQRASASSTLARDRKTIRRRLIVVVLVLLSLVLLTISFRESSSGPLHRFQGYGSEATRPFQVVADRIARPFEDGYGWIHSMSKAKKENKQLRQDVKHLTQQLEQQKNNGDEARHLAAVLRFLRRGAPPGRLFPP